MDIYDVVDSRLTPDELDRLRDEATKNPVHFVDNLIKAIIDETAEKY